MTECDLCHDEPAVTRRGAEHLCQTCVDAHDYYASLTPAEWAAEEAAMAAYVDETRDSR